MPKSVLHARNSCGNLVAISLVNEDGSIEDIYEGEELDILLDGVHQYFSNDPYSGKLPTDEEVLEFIQHEDAKSCGC